MMRRAAVLCLLTMTISLRAELRFELQRASLTGTHCRYREYVNGVVTDRFVIQPCVSGQDVKRETSFARADGIAWRDGRLTRREVHVDIPLEPYAFDYDVESGQL